MATEYSILEGELTELKKKLKRELHMHQLGRLRKKKSDLATSIIQRKQIENLTKQLDELETTVSKLYCPDYALKDNEIKGYLVYLLKMKDFFSREVTTKEEMIRQRESQIKILTRKHCSVVEEQALLRKNIPVKPPEYIRLENMSSRLNQMNKNICLLRHENREIMENVMNMKKFQTQFRKFESNFRLKIDYLKDKSHELLEKAVTAYEEKEEFMSKEKMYQDRCAQDTRKIAINENSLDLCLQKAERNSSFAKLQAAERTDIRVAKTSEMIEQSITGLEPNLKEAQQLQSTISEAAGAEDPEKMEENFKMADDKIGMMFSYLDELLKEIHHLERNIVHLKEENRKLFKNMSAEDRKLRKQITINKDKEQTELGNADEATKKLDQTRAEFDELLDFVKALYIMCSPGCKESLQQKPMDDSNAIDYMQNMEKQLLDHLICLQYIRMQEASKEDQPLMLETEEDEDVSDQIDTTEDLDIIQPRALSSKETLETLAELETKKSFMGFEELKEKAVAVLDEIQSEKSLNEDKDEDVN